MKFLLCGLPGSGKSFIGKAVAHKMNVEFVDTDELIEQAYNKKHNTSKTTREIYQEHGRTFFQILEKQVLESLNVEENCIIALGGGSLDTKDAQNIVKKLGKVIYLNAHPTNLLERILDNGIPPYLDPESPAQSFHKLADKRHPIFESVAHYTVDVEQTEFSPVDTICEWISNGK